MSDKELKAIGGVYNKMIRKKYTSRYSFRCDNEIEDMIEDLMNKLDLNKSELLRECVRNYYDSLCGTG